MQKTVEISVIIAAYNVENYLERAIRSILDQSFDEFEIIVVDDGSSDKTGEIAKNLAEEDERICVNQLENRGVSAARNFAIEKASGKYIYFMDSDDYVDSTMLFDTYEQITRTNADLVVFGFYFETWKDNNLVQQFPTNSNYNIYDNKEQIQNQFVEL